MKYIERFKRVAKTHTSSALRPRRGSITYRVAVLLMKYSDYYLTPREVALFLFREWSKKTLSAVQTSLYYLSRARLVYVDGRLGRVVHAGRLGYRWVWAS